MDMDMDKQHSAGEELAGGYGTPTPEQETAGPGEQQPKPQEQESDSTSGASQNGVADVPSADAEMDESNTEPTQPGRPYSSEPKGDATGFPDETSPNGDDEE